MPTTLQFKMALTVLFRNVVDAAMIVCGDFDAGNVSNLHPSFLNDRKRKYQSSEIEQIATDFWEKDATIPEPTYRKVR